jgi:hypothetical protein
MIVLAVTPRSVWLWATLRLLNLVLNWGSYKWGVFERTRSHTFPYLLFPQANFKVHSRPFTALYEPLSSISILSR